MRRFFAGLLAVMSATLMTLTSTMRAQWGYSFDDMGVEYTPTDLGGSSTNHTFSLLRDMTWYNHSGSDSALAYLERDKRINPAEKSALAADPPQAGG